MRRSERIADVAVRVMRAAGEDRVCFGDGILQVIAHEAGLVSAPLYEAMQKVLDGLERAPDLFDKGTTLGWDSRGYERRVRLFKILPAGPAS